MSNMEIATNCGVLWRRGSVSSAIIMRQPAQCLEHRSVHYMDITVSTTGIIDHRQYGCVSLWVA